MTDDQLVSNLEVHLGYWLRHVSNHVSGSFARALQHRHFTIAEWVALRQLFDHPDITPADLAELMGTTRGATSKIIDKLEAKGLTGRIVREEDKRSHSLFLTAEGSRILPELAMCADQNDANYFGCLDIHEQSQLRYLLQKVAQSHGWNDVPVD